jgi:hypothetical protein
VEGGWCFPEVVVWVCGGLVVCWERAREQAAVASLDCFVSVAKKEISVSQPPPQIQEQHKVTR